MRERNIWKTKYVETNINCSVADSLSSQRMSLYMLFIFFHCQMFLKTSFYFFLHVYHSLEGTVAFPAPSTKQTLRISCHHVGFDVHVLNASCFYICPIRDCQRTSAWIWLSEKWWPIKKRKGFGHLQMKISKRGFIKNFMEELLIAVLLFFLLFFLASVYLVPSSLTN